MKRIIIIFLILVSILAGCTSGNSKGDSKYKITFRDIPWLVSETEFDKLLSADKGIGSKELDIMNGTTSIYCPLTDRKYLLRAVCIDYDFFDYRKDGYPYQVGGYGVHTIEAYFLPPITQKHDSISFEDDSKAQLYMVKYCLSIGENWDDAKQDLIKKLTAVYGKPTNEYTLSNSKSYTQWIAEDNSSVVLEERKKSNYSMFHITYCLLDTDYLEKNETLNVALGKQGTQTNTLDTDGL